MSSVIAALPPSRRTWRARAFVIALLGAAAFAGPTFGWASEARAESKIAVVDLRRAVMETEEGLRVQATLKKLFDARQIELSNRERDLTQERDKLEQAAKEGKLPADELRKREAEFNRQMGELQRTLMEYQNEMQIKEKELTNPIVNSVLGHVRSIAAKEGYDMVIDRSAVPYVRSDLDVTDRAIQAHNTGGVGAPAPKKPAPKKPAPAAPKK
jgi:outer membrane protein